MSAPLCIGRNPVHRTSAPVSGEWTELEGETFYRIANVDRLRPFFISVVSSSDLWMFISSAGGLTAGRRNPDLALFPYYTDDKIHDAAEHTGSKTLLIVRRGARQCLWEPFSTRQDGAYRIQRNLYKNVWGNQLVFEECNHDLELTFRYGWFSSGRFGFVRRGWLKNHGARPTRIRLLDGLQNLMPCGVGSQFQLDKSTLLDAYKRSELLAGTGLALCRLSSIPVDRPEPAESLRTNVVWSLGLARHRTLLSAVQLDRFRSALPLQDETDVRGVRGAYFVESNLSVTGGATTRWELVADVNKGPSDVAELQQMLRRPAKLRRLLREDIDRGTRELRQVIASADGLQKTARLPGDARHSSNVLFNVMRGGVFAEGYNVDTADLRQHLGTANRQVVVRQAEFLRRLPRVVSYPQLVDLAAESGDGELERLCREYLPLTFSRRHGDPSRPWNRFSIVTRNEDGTRVLNYEGNWRDIFQNWEALAVSFPGFLSGMICRFLSASTADGYNPYRITRDGIDWEVVNPSDPWAHIGYWGDHQLIYLLKLLELLKAREPAVLRSFLRRDLFAYANVPYRIKPYAQLVRDPKDTVLFAEEVENLVRGRVESRGADGRLIWQADGRVLQVNLTEKLLVAILAKLANFIPEAGLWLNTQRPEWNDANNALVGNGVSVVTLCYLRRYLAFCLELFSEDKDTAAVSAEVCQLLASVARTLRRHRSLLQDQINNADRRVVLDELGNAASRYRERLYCHGLSGQRNKLPVARLREFCALALDWVDHGIRANRRPDGLYHAYNLVRFDPRGAVSIRRLYEMLEGQVAVLSSGRLSAEESVRLLQALRQSRMYRPDQHSYLLYPNRDLPRFIEKNNIPLRDVRQSRLLQALLQRCDRTLVERDVRGGCHFNGSLTNARDVETVLEKLAHTGYAALVRRDSQRVLDLFERLFDHESFTGRSGTFFAYEGLGSIYWHMVSKLLLAAQECFTRAVDQGASPAMLRQLAKGYDDIRAGIGDYKSPAEYGAFPMDPYSHTPAHTGARQPGLTGQVKEDFLCRLGELGISVCEGRIAFQPRLLRASEFLTASADFRFFDITGKERKFRLGPRSIAFTYCQVPVVYQLASESLLAVSFADGSEGRFETPHLDAGTSRSVLARAGKVSRVVLRLPENQLIPRRG